MPRLPQPPADSPTVLAIYAAYEANNQPRDGKTIPVGQLAEECSRKLWLDFRWASPHEQHTGRMLRLFETGNIAEERWIENLRMIGCEVVDRDPDTGNQIRVELAGGHVGGYLDSEIIGLPEAPKTWHVGEMKSHNAKSFAALKKDGVQKAKVLHYGQMQLYMHARGRTRAIYLAVCKDTDELYAERIHYDAAYCLRLLAKAERIRDANEAPPRVESFACRWCRNVAVCKEGAMARVNCRTCIYSSPEEGGTWSCARFNKPLSLAEQAEGCAAHLYLPTLVPGTQVDVSETEEWIEYRMADGSVWRDGGVTEKQDAA